jgi:hypothetical protein
MNREPLNLPIPVLIVISASSIVLLLYMSLYAISQTTKKNKSAEMSSYEENPYQTGFDATEFLAHPPQETVTKERELRNTAQSDFERMSQETKDQLQRMKTERDLLKTQRSLQTL